MRQAIVAWASPWCQKLIPVDLPDTPIKAMEVIEESNISLYVTSYDAIGVFGEEIDPNRYTVQDGDRIELYRHLESSAEELRQKRIKSGSNPATSKQIKKQGRSS